jgi:clan AA aspartic protease (TIGR02281 family)
MNRFHPAPAAALALLLLASPADAEILRWVDDQGKVHYTDAYNIPPKYRAKATTIKGAKPPPAGAGDLSRTSVPLQVRGNVALVQATFNNRASASLIVDTGASWTVISRSVARELGIQIEGSNLPMFEFRTANGVVSAPVVKIESIDVGGMEVRNLTASVMDIGPDVSGLLGLNYLSNFRIDIDSKNRMLHLEKK